MKKPISTKKRNLTGAIIGIVIAVVISAGVIYFYNHRVQPDSTLQGITSGPFSINNGTYRLGDNVFMVVTGLKPTDVGKVVIYDPKGGIFDQFPFNGSMKTEFNYFFKPYTLKSEKLCSAQDLIGNWTIAFPGTLYKSIPFRIINQWVPGDQADTDLKPIPNC